MDLDIMPSPVPDRPGLLVRDPFKFSDSTLIIPPLLVPCLQCFDGEQTELDLRRMLVEITGELSVSELANHLRDTLSGAGFLYDEAFAKLRDARVAAFRQGAVRSPSHAGSAYPEDLDELHVTMSRYMKDAGPAESPDGLIGIASPHVSPDGGWKCYRDAYAKLNKAYADRVFVVLGTSHYGQPGRFGLTRKSYATPLGSSETAVDLVDSLEKAAPDAVVLEDYCHAVEHSIEFQVLFLQSVVGPHVRVLPVLCGSFGESIANGGKPEDEQEVRRFLDALREVKEKEGKRLFWVLGVDMTHIGARYGDRFAARSEQGPLVETEERDRGRIERLNHGDADGFWELVKQNGDDLKWCGSAPFYTFSRVVPEARGQLERYEQWNIDEESVVSFAGMTFTQAPPPSNSRVGS
jgi:MEMO1 family protein